MAGSTPGCISLAGSHVDLATGELHQRLGPKTTAVLACLAERPGELISKEDLLAKVWPDVAVTDYVIWRCICDLRKALGRGDHRGDIVETLPRRGYRLAVEVEILDDGSSETIRMAGGSSAGSRVLTEPDSVAAIWPLAVLSMASILGFWAATRLRTKTFRKRRSKEG